MKRYPDCIRTDGLCGLCSLTNRGLDCHNKQINKLLYQRSVAEMTQMQLSEASGVNIRQIQKYECGEYETGNMTLRTAFSLAAALECDIKDFFNLQSEK